MPARLDLRGQRFGRLVVKDYGEKTRYGQIRYVCICDCGNTSLVRTHALISGRTTSCGRWSEEHKAQSAHRFIDLTGQRFDRLLVQERGPNSKSGKVQWKCLCDCGKTIMAFACHLRRKCTRSCGCLRREMLQATHTIHGNYKIPEYHVYWDMRRRCNDPDSPQYSYYGGRGITVSWERFEDFFADMGPRPTPKHTVERRDNDGPYSKENCYWATRLEQANNKRSNHFVEFNGQKMTMAQLARVTGLPYDTVRWRVKHSQSLLLPRQRRSRRTS